MSVMKSLWGRRGKRTAAASAVPRPRRRGGPYAALDHLSEDEYLGRLSEALGVPVYDSRDAAAALGLLPDDWR